MNSEDNEINYYDRCKRSLENVISRWDVNLEQFGFTRVETVTYAAFDWDLDICRSRLEEIARQLSIEVDYNLDSTDYDRIESEVNLPGTGAETKLLLAEFMVGLDAYHCLEERGECVIEE